MTIEEINKFVADSESKANVILVIYNDLLASVKDNEAATMHAHCLFARIADLNRHNLTMLSKFADNYGAVYSRSEN